MSASFSWIETYSKFTDVVASPKPLKREDMIDMKVLYSATRMVGFPLLSPNVFPNVFMTDATVCHPWTASVVNIAFWAADVHSITVHRVYVSRLDACPKSLRNIKEYESNVNVVIQTKSPSSSSFSKTIAEPSMFSSFLCTKNDYSGSHGVRKIG